MSRIERLSRFPDQSAQVAPSMQRPSTEWQNMAMHRKFPTEESDISLLHGDEPFRLINRIDHPSPPMHRPSFASSKHSSQIPQLEETAKLPCFVLPPTRTSRFFDRSDVMRHMEEHFGKVDPNQSFRSLALWGLGGVGKSSVALRFAELKLLRNELDALFWVSSETNASIGQSFTEIATKLKLAEARPGDPDENVKLVLDWLSNTRKSPQQDRALGVLSAVRMSMAYHL